MARLGDFGAEFVAAERDLSQERDEFGFCGEEFVIEQPIPPVLMLKLGATITGGADEMAGMGAVWNAFRYSLTVPAHKGEDGAEVPADESQFLKWERIATERAVDMDTLLATIMAVFQAQSGRPTRQAPASSAGPPTISPSSKPSVTHQAPSHLRSVDDLIKNGMVASPSSEANVIRMGDGTLVEVDYNTPPPKVLTG